MKTLNSTPGALRLLALSLAARLPLVMLGIGLMVHTARLTGSYAAAGVVTGAHALAVGVGGPLLARVVDRRGQTLVLVAGATVAAGLLAVVACLPAGTPLPVLVALAAAIGFALPPVGACMRSLLPGLMPDPGAARSLYAVEASAVELTWVVGPPLALGLGALISTGAALAIAGLALLVGTLAFAAQTSSREWRPQRSAERVRGGALRSGALQTLVVALVAVGVLVGAVEVAVAAAATSLGSSAAAGPLLGIWGVGSLAGGVLATRLGGGARSARGLGLVLAALTAGHLVLAATAGSIAAMGAVLFVAGAAIAPTFASAYAMVDRAAPAGAVTEAFAWLATALAVGGAAGAAAGGAMADGAGPAAAFVLAGAAGAVAVLVTALRAGTLCERPVRDARAGELILAAA
ncbi:MAG TPA: MFS transporter [Gaiellales bacterium]|jgi:predicted MFS family arabinose efflux permease